MVAVVKPKATPTVKPVATSTPKVVVKETPKVVVKETKVVKPVVAQVAAKPSVSVDAVSTLAASVMPKTATKQTASPAIPAVGAALQESREEATDKMLRLTPEEVAEIEANEAAETTEAQPTDDGKRKKIIIAVVLVVAVVALTVWFLRKRKK